MPSLFSEPQVNFSDPTLQSLPLTFYQPFKFFYIVFRILHLFILIPLWTLYYSNPSFRPRRSWTLQECVSIRLVKWFMPLNSKCGLHPLSLDKTRDPTEKELHKMKETDFMWIDSRVEEEGLVQGSIASDDKVKPIRVPAYVWPKGQRLEDAQDLVGLWIHGGGYMMGNATEHFGESEIPRQLSKQSKIKNILSIDYRLVHEAPHPAQLLDALSGYAYLVKTLGISPKRIVLIGACAGGNLVMLLMRYLSEEKVLEMPGGIMLFSPVLDMTIDLEMSQGLCGARPNTKIDMLATSHIPNIRLMGERDLGLLASPWYSSNRSSTGHSRIYSSYPPTFLSVGSAECLFKEVHQLYTLMKEDGVDVEMDAREDAVHDFMGFPAGGSGMVTIPNEEGRKVVIRKAAMWLERLKNRDRV